MNKIKIFVNDLVNVSRLTKTKNKKIKIFITALISNLIVLMDILIILTFTYVFSNKVSVENVLTNYMFSNLQILPMLIMVRYFCVYYEKINIAKLRLEVEESLREQLINEILKELIFSLMHTFM